MSGPGGRSPGGRTSRVGIIFDWRVNSVSRLASWTGSTDVRVGSDLLTCGLELICHGFSADSAGPDGEYLGWRQGWWALAKNVRLPDRGVDYSDKSVKISLRSGGTTLASYPFAGSCPACEGFFMR